MKIALLGKPETCLFKQCHATVVCQAGELSTVESHQCLDQFLELIQRLSTEVEQVPPDLVVVVQDHPDQFSPEQVDQLLGINPLLRWVCCLGPWSESEGRNRDTWPIAVCTSSDRFEARLQIELNVLEGELPALPLTASRNERFLFETSQRTVPCAELGSVELITRDPGLREFYSDLLKTSGYRISDSNSEENTIRLKDLDPWEQIKSELDSGELNLEDSQPVLGLTNEISHAVQEEMHHSGFQSVIPKLADVNQLLTAMSNLKSNSVSEPVPLQESKPA